MENFALLNFMIRFCHRFILAFKIDAFGENNVIVNVVNTIGKII